MMFSAWGTTVHLLTRDPAHLPALAELTKVILREVGGACSRFDPDSDLSRVNRHPGEWVAVDPLLIAALRAALNAAEQTDGWVTPLLGRVLIELGYDRDLRALRATSESVRHTRPDPAAWQQIEISDEAVRIPHETALDLGSIAKAWTADLIAVTHAAEHGTPALINLGGDLAVSTPDGEPWLVGVAQGTQHPVETTVSILSGGVATSSTRLRRWRRAGREWHHVLDPRTNRPTTGPWDLVTVAAPSATTANTMSTAAIVAGDEAIDWLTRRGAHARLCGPQGVEWTGQWPTSVADTRRPA